MIGPSNELASRSLAFTEVTEQTLYCATYSLKYLVLYCHPKHQKELDPCRAPGTIVSTIYNTTGQRSTNHANQIIVWAAPSNTTSIHKQIGHLDINQCCNTQVIKVVLIALATWIWEL